MQKPRKNKVVRAWVNQHVNNHYVHLAQRDGYRSRAAYKLLEFDAEINLFTNVTSVVDLGSAPGSWSQVAKQKIGERGIVIGVDLLEMAPIHGVHFIQGDFTEAAILASIIAALSRQNVDLVISDMSPNLSGVRGVDQARGAYLIELVLDFCRNYLRTGGDCLIKVFHGGEFDNLLKQAREIFNIVNVRKPDASRSKSSETYLLCRNKKSLDVI